MDKMKTILYLSVAYPRKMVERFIWNFPKQHRESTGLFGGSLKQNFSFVKLQIHNRPI